MVDENSQLKLVCIGVVAFDKPTASDIIKVYPAERLAFEDGDVPNSKEDMETDVVDISGVPFKAKVVRTAVITARWFPDGDDGRQTAPDVINGETVKIYRYSDSVDYYWKTMFREPNLRRLEHVVHAYCDLKSGRDIFGLDSSYGTIFSTKDKYIKIWTSLSNEEKFKYEFKIDTQSSYYLMTDNIGNKFGFISEEEKIYLENSAGSFIEAVKDSIEINSGDIVKVITPHVLVNASTNVIVNSPYVRINTPDFNVGGPGEHDSEGGHDIPGNRIGVNEEKVTAYLENSDESSIHAVREDINIKSNENINVTTTNALVDSTNTKLKSSEVVETTAPLVKTISSHKEIVSDTDVIITTPKTLIITEDFKVTDNKGNNLGVISEEDHLYLENNSKSYLQVIKEDINIHANKNILISTPCEVFNDIDDEKLVIMVPTVVIGNKDLEELPFRLQVFGDVIANRIFIIPFDGEEQNALNSSNLPGSPVSLDETISNLNTRIDDLNLQITTANSRIDQLVLEIETINSRIVSLP